MVQFDGSTHTVQAAVGSTLFHSRMAFGGLPGNLGNLVVNADRLFHGLNSDIVQFTTTLSNARISVMPNGAGNAIVGCPSGYTLQSTVVLLSHNLRRVTLAEALAGPNNIADQTFDLIDCTAEKIGVASGHQEWHRVNADGSLSYGNLFAGPALHQYGQTAEEFADMLSPAGFQGNDTGGSWHDRAQIYELVIGGHRMFFILRHAVEWDGTLSTANTPSRQYVELLIPR